MRIANWRGLPELAGLLQVVGEDVEQELRVRVSVVMPVRLGIEELPQLERVDQVAVLLCQRRPRRETGV